MRWSLRLRSVLVPAASLLLPGLGGCFDPSHPMSSDGGDGSSGGGGTSDGTDSVSTTASTTATTTASTTATTTATATDSTTMSTTVADSSSDGGTETTGVGEGCGNDMVEDGEGCDDGNTASGDGCSAACQDESLFCDPRIIGTYDNLFDPLAHLSAAGSFVAVADGGFTAPVVALIDISDPTEPLFQTGVNVNGAQFIDLIGRSDRVFAVGDPLVTAFDISDPDAMTITQQIDGSNQFGFQAGLVGGTLYIADDSTTRVVNVTDIHNMSLTGGSLNLMGVMFPSYDGVAAAGTRAFVSVSPLGVFDITNPTTPVLQGTVTIDGGGTLRASDDGNFVYFHTGDGFGIVDATDATDPVQLSTVAVQNNVASRDHAVRGSFVYVAGSNGKIFTYDATDPAAPVQANQLDVGDGPAVRVEPGDDFLYVLHGGTLHLAADLPGYCAPTCGNGVTEWPELCDDGDLESGDDCDADCTL